jgi:hypothetical protein
LRGFQLSTIAENFRNPSDLDQCDVSSPVKNRHLAGICWLCAATNPGIIVRRSKAGALLAMVKFLKNGEIPCSSTASATGLR